MDQITITVQDQAMVADARTFSSGSRGFYASGKVTFGGKRYQCSVNVVEIGSKPGSTPAAPVAAVKNGKAALS